MRPCGSPLLICPRSCSPPDSGASWLGCKSITPAAFVAARADFFCSLILLWNRCALLEREAGEPISVSTFRSCRIARSSFAGLVLLFFRKSAHRYMPRGAGFDAGAAVPLLMSIFLMTAPERPSGLAYAPRKSLPLCPRIPAPRPRQLGFCSTNSTNAGLNRPPGFLAIPDLDRLKRLIAHRRARHPDRRWYARYSFRPLDLRTHLRTRRTDSTRDLARFSPKESLQGLDWLDSRSSQARARTGSRTPNCSAGINPYCRVLGAIPWCAGLDVPEAGHPTVRSCAKPAPPKRRSPHRAVFYSRLQFRESQGGGGGGGRGTCTAGRAIHFRSSRDRLCSKRSRSTTSRFSTQATPKPSTRASISIITFPPAPVRDYDRARRDQPALHHRLFRQTSHSPTAPWANSRPGLGACRTLEQHQPADHVHPRLAAGTLARAYNNWTPGASEQLTSVDFRHRAFIDQAGGRAKGIVYEQPLSNVSERGAGAGRFSSGR